MDAPEATEQHPDDPTLIYAFRRIPEFGNRATTNPARCRVCRFCRVCLLLDPGGAVFTIRE
jgi:hypothetical protein